jgi:membrane-associated phospholipid phosphatase
MFAFEWISLCFFLVLVAVAAWHGQGRAALAATALAVVVAATAAVGGDLLRGWLGHLYLAAGYWIPAWLAAGPPSDRFEAWLAAGDLRCRSVTWRVPRWMIAAGDLAYLLCYPLVPLAFVIVSQLGGVDGVVRYWTAVLAAGFACYGTLPWLVSRPPRLRVRMSSAGTLAQTNAWLLSRISHQRNTFPSGHVAVAIAAACVCAAVSPIAGLICGVVAAGVAVGAFSGGYHYAADVVAGGMVGIVCGLVGLAA